MKTRSKIEKDFFVLNCKKIEISVGTLRKNSNSFLNAKKNQSCKFGTTQPQIKTVHQPSQTLWNCDRKWTAGPSVDWEPALGREQHLVVEMCFKRALERKHSWAERTRNQFPLCCCFIFVLLVQRDFLLLYVLVCKISIQDCVRRVIEDCFQSTYFSLTLFGWFYMSCKLVVKLHWVVERC